jgi:hypothetical protein
MRRILVAAAGVAASALTAALLFEVILRIVGFSAPVWYRPDPVLGWALRAGVEGRFNREGNAYVRINSAGLRDREHALDKPADAYRIAVLGDSYAEAMQVERQDAFWSLLEDELERCEYQPGKRIEVINFGVSGFGTAQEYAMLETAAIRYRPDLVLLQFMNGNDVTDNSSALNGEKLRPYFNVDARNGLVRDASFAETEAFRSRTASWKRALRGLADHSSVAQLVRTFKQVALAPRARAEAMIEPGVNAAVLVPPRDLPWRRAWAVTERLLVAMHDYLDKRGVPLVVVTTPFATQVHPDRQLRRRLEAQLGIPDLFYPDRRLETYLRRHGIAVIPLAYEMQRWAERSGANLYGFANNRLGFGHWNEMGHRVAAQLIAARLCPDRTRSSIGPNGLVRLGRDVNRPS